MKQVIVARGDLDLPHGKLAAQVAHAAVSASNAASPEARAAWLEEGQRKVVLRVESVAELGALQEEAQQQDLPTALISDAGRTELPPGTTTTLGIGPAAEEAIDAVTGSLPLY